MYEPQYVVTATLFLPLELENLPFYNTTVVVEGGSIGSSYATDIARRLFKNFKDLFSKKNLQDLLEKTTASDLYKNFQFVILDKQNNSQQIEEGSSSVAIATINEFLNLIKRNIQA